MPIARFLRSAWIRRMADNALLTRQRRKAESARARQGHPHEVLYFHQVDDPYSHLATQVLRAFLHRYEVRMKPHVVSAPTPVAIHDPALWSTWCRRECAAMAPYYSLAYQDHGREPEIAQTDLARRVLLNLESHVDFAEAAVAVGQALNAGDGAALDALASRHGALTQAEAMPRLQANFDLRHELGHYLGAMFFHAGEWYWGIDRLHFLEARLDQLGARRNAAPIGTSARLLRRAPHKIDTAQRITMEFFPSLRSPYTHISYAAVASLCRRYPVDLVCRPVLPMMMRGVKADRRKSAYIIRDTRREADRLGVPFGNVWDPFGDPVRRGYSLFPWARDRGKGFEYLHSFSNAVWSEGVNAWAKAGLKMIVERAGLTWSEAEKLLDNQAWEAEMQRNVDDMITAGSWGVPTLRLPASNLGPEFTVWGQDRIWLIEEEIARRLGR